LIMIAGVPSLFGVPLDDDALGVASAVMRIDVELAVVAAGREVPFAILKDASTDVTFGRQAGGADDVEDVKGFLWDGGVGDGRSG